MKEGDTSLAEGVRDLMQQEINRLQTKLAESEARAEQACKVTDDEISEFRNKYAPIHRIGIEFGAEWMRQQILNRPRQQQTNDTAKKCNGTNCNAMDGINHSPECFAEHESTVSNGAGNRNPESRYKGYTNEPLRDNATPDQKAAWEEGSRARFNQQTNGE